MARVLICHVPKDGSTARDVGSALMGRGHFVSFEGEPDQPRPDRVARLRQFEAVVVIWTEASAQNAGLAAIAHEVMPLNLLVPVRSEDLAPVRLPLAFRKLNLLAARDMEGIARCVARVSTAVSSLREMTERQARREAETEKERRAPPPLPSASLLSQKATAPGRPRAASAGQPLPPAADRATSLPTSLPLHLPDVGITSPLAQFRDSAAFRELRDRASATVVNADDLSRAVDSGLLEANIPNPMWLGDTITAEITLGRDILAGLVAPEVIHGEARERQSIETLSVSLYGEHDAFDVERQSERTQFVSRKLALAARDPETFGRWVWLVTPRVSGPQKLIVRISALLRDRHGVPAPLALPDRRMVVEVGVQDEAGIAAALAAWHRR